jgi:predicted DNA repair protein MutK
MKGLSIVGTIAMFMVGGGILTHGIPGAHEWIERIAHGAGSVQGIGRLLESVLPTLLDAFVGLVAGALVLLGVIVVGKFLRTITPTH